MSNDLTITFYSSPPEEQSHSKYPKQNKKSYKMPWSALGSAGGNITIPNDAREADGGAVTHRPLYAKRERQRLEGFKPPSTTKPEAPAPVDAVTAASARPRRTRKTPNRYEPTEQVMDDYKDTEYDSDSGCSSD
mgnify:CR=1 FL=1|jgi:hypothetical protein